MKTHPDQSKYCLTLSEEALKNKLGDGKLNNLMRYKMGEADDAK